MSVIVGVRRVIHHTAYSDTPMQVKTTEWFTCTGRSCSLFDEWCVLVWCRQWVLHARRGRKHAARFFRQLRWCPWHCTVGRLCLLGLCLLSRVGLAGGIVSVICDVSSLGACRVGLVSAAQFLLVCFQFANCCFGIHDFRCLVLWVGGEPRKTAGPTLRGVAGSRTLQEGPHVC